MYYQAKQQTQESKQVQAQQQTQQQAKYQASLEAQAQASKQVQERLELLIRHIYSDFNENQWYSFKTNNIVTFRNKLAPLDEFYVEISENSLYEIKVSIPVNEVNYKKTFMNINEAVSYIKMHAGLYDSLYRR